MRDCSNCQSDLSMSMVCCECEDGSNFTQFSDEMKEVMNILATLVIHAKESNDYSYTYYAGIIEEIYNERKTVKCKICHSNIEIPRFCDICKEL